MSKYKIIHDNLWAYLLIWLFAHTIGNWIEPAIDIYGIYSSLDFRSGLAIVIIVFAAYLCMIIVARKGIRGSAYMLIACMFFECIGYLFNIIIMLIEYPYIYNRLMLRSLILFIVAAYLISVLRHARSFAKQKAS